MADRTALAEKLSPLVSRPWFPWIAAFVAVLLFGTYLFATGRHIPNSDFFGHVWMALEELEGGVGSSTNIVIPAGYPVLLNILHLFGLPYLSAGRLLTLLAAIPVLSLVWIAASRVGPTQWAGAVAWVAFATSYPFLVAVAMPLPDMLALALAMPLIVLAFSPGRSTASVILAAISAGLSCCIRYNFLFSIVPLSFFLVLTAHPVSWRRRGREALAMVLGVAIGLLPEIIFALRIGHIPFQNSSKYYLKLLDNSANFLMTATQLKMMPSTLEYLLRHRAVIIPVVVKAYLLLASIFVLAPAAIWWVAVKAGKSRPENQMHRKIMALLIFEAALLLPVSLRQPLPVYVVPMMSFPAFIIFAVSVVRIVNGRRAMGKSLIIFMVVSSILQASLALSTIEKEFSTISFNETVGTELRNLGISDSAEVLNLASPLDFYWPYGERAPLLYYTKEEPGWLALTNTLPQKRPFLYKITDDDLKLFRAVITSNMTNEESRKTLPGFRLVKWVRYVQIYASSP